MKYIFTLIVIVLWSAVVKGQGESFQDSTYIESFAGELDLTTRLYSSVKYSRLWIQDEDADINIRYRTNVNYILGVGVNYKHFGLNLGLNFPFVNNDNDIRGETKYLDAQGHYYYKKSVVDLWLSRYKGYFLYNRYQATDQLRSDPSYPLRPGMVNTNIGVSAMHVFNAKKYSFRAAYAHDEWQKRSAGSFLLGADVHAMLTKADSSHIPGNVKEADFFDEYQVNKISILNFSVNGGYAHTFVVNQHWFFAFSVVGAYGLRHVSLESELDTQPGQDDFKFSLALHGKAALGYNSETYFFGVTAINSWVFNRTAIPGTRVTLVPGNIRLHLVRRFKLNKPLYIPLIHKKTK